VFNDVLQLLATGDPREKLQLEVVVKIVIFVKLAIFAYFHLKIKRHISTKDLNK